MAFRISRHAAQMLLAAAADSPDTEICGLLIGSDAIDEAVPARNVAPRPATGFEIDPATLLATHREARGRGLRVIGHYHSHPNGRGEPSRRDAARALEDGQLWLIIANGDLHGWRAVADGPVQGRFAPVPLEVA